MTDLKSITIPESVRFIHVIRILVVELIILQISIVFSLKPGGLFFKLILNNAITILHQI